MFTLPIVNLVWRKIPQTGYHLGIYLEQDLKEFDASIKLKSVKFNQASSQQLKFPDCLIYYHLFCFSGIVRINISKTVYD